MDSTPSLHDLLKSQCDAACVWDCTLPFQEGDYSQLDESSVVSLSKCLHNQDHDYMFPLCYVGEASEAKLLLEIRLAALLDGFSLVIGSRLTPEYYRGQASTNRYKSVRLICDRNRKQCPSKGMGIRKVHTKRGATLDDCCPFAITVYLRRM